MSEDARSALKARIGLIEESYEYMLAYAARGIAASRAAGADIEVRQYLERVAAALVELPALYDGAVEEARIETAEPYHAFREVLERDAHAAGAAVRLVLARAAIGSQLVDNLNASIHLRALLTDLFLIDEALETA